jgi:hypothetical protein
MPRRRGNRRGKGKKRNVRRGGRKMTPKSTQVPGTVTLRSPLVAPSTIVPLRIVVEGQLVGSNAVAIRYNPNDAYTPIVGGSSGTVPSYSTWAALYGFYRVLSYSYSVEMINTEAFPISVYILNQNNDPGTAPNISKSANPLSQRKNLSAQGGMDRVKFRKRVTIPQILGSDSSMVDSDYRALNNASPADVVWLAIGLWTMTNASTTLGVRYQLTLTMRTQWFDRLLQ